MKVDTISEAKAQLSTLVERALAGEEVIIGRAGKPVVRLVPVTQRVEQRRPGTLKGRLRIAPDCLNAADLATRTNISVDGQGLLVFAARWGRLVALRLVTSRGGVAPTRLNSPVHANRSGFAGGPSRTPPIASRESGLADVRHGASLERNYRGRFCRPFSFEKTGVVAIVVLGRELSFWCVRNHG